MRRALVVVLLAGCGSSGSPATSTGGAAGDGNTGGSAGSTSTGGAAGNGQAGAAGSAAGAPGGSAGGQAGPGGAAGGGAAGASGHGQAGALGAAGAAGGAAGAAPSCGAPPTPSTSCSSLAVDGACVLPTFVVGSWPAGVFTSGTTPKGGTYQLTAVTYYGTAADAGAGFDCEGSAPLRETIEISGFAPSFNLQVAEAQTGIALAVQDGSIAFMSSSYTGPPSLPTSYAYSPTCASGPTGTNTETGGWGATSTTVTLSGFTRVGCMHGGKLRSGTEVDTFTLAP